MTRLTLLTDCSLLSATERTTRYVLARVAAPRADAAQERTPVRVAFVLDRSGSMQGEKIRLARQAVHDALGLLRAEDRFAIAAYDRTVDIVVPETAATEDAVARARLLLMQYNARSLTNLSEGWLKGCREIGGERSGEALQRAILLTDGLANEGITSPAELAQHARELRNRGISTTALGVGEDFDEELLRLMAVNGGGNFYFADSAAKLPEIFASEIGEALAVVVQEACLRIRLPTSASVRLLSAFSSTRLPQDLRVDLGALVSAQVLDVLLEVSFQPASPGEQQTIEATAGDGSDGPATHAPAPLVWTYAAHEALQAAASNDEVLAAVAQVEAAAARLKAVELNKAGRFDDARAALDAAAVRLAKLPATATAVRDAIGALKDDLRIFGRAMAESDRKRHHLCSHTSLSSRAADGRARRWDFDPDDHGP